jgi:hypothetical protein
VNPLIVDLYYIVCQSPNTSIWTTRRCNAIPAILPISKGLMSTISQNSIYSFHIYLGVQITCHATLQQLSRAVYIENYAQPITYFERQMWRRAAGLVSQFLVLTSIPACRDSRCNETKRRYFEFKRLKICELIKHFYYFYFSYIIYLSWTHLIY